jgi:hypothetical protein
MPTIIYSRLTAEAVRLYDFLATSRNQTDCVNRARAAFNLGWLCNWGPAEQGVPIVLREKPIHDGIALVMKDPRGNFYKINQGEFRTSEDLMEAAHSEALNRQEIPLRNAAEYWALMSRASNLMHPPVDEGVAEFRHTLHVRDETGNYVFALTTKTGRLEY